jgi:hypothetical protein
MSSSVHRYCLSCTVQLGVCDGEFLACKCDKGCAIIDDDGHIFKKVSSELFFKYRSILLTTSFGKEGCHQNFTVIE